MPPPRDAAFWMVHDRRVIPRRPRRLLREQDEAITSERLVAQVNAVPNRPMQSPREVKYILRVLRWTTLPTGETQRQKGWNIASPRDSHIRAFGYKQLMRFLPTLARQRVWYPGVSNRTELWRCAKCEQLGRPKSTSSTVPTTQQHTSASESDTEHSNKGQTRGSTQVHSGRGHRWAGCKVASIHAGRP